MEILGWLLVMVGGLTVHLAVFGPGDVASWGADVAVGWVFLGGALLLRERRSDGRIAILLGLTATPSSCARRPPRWEGGLSAFRPDRRSGPRSLASSARERRASHRRPSGRPGPGGRRHGPLLR